MHAVKMSTMMTNFLVKIIPSMDSHGRFLGSIPMAPSKVPAGQMYLQNLKAVLFIVSKKTTDICRL